MWRKVGEEKYSGENSFATKQLRLFRCWSRAVTLESRQITAWIIARAMPLVLYIHLRSSTSGRLLVFLITWARLLLFRKKKPKTFSNLRPIISYHDPCSSSSISVSPSIYQIHTSSWTRAASFHITSGSWFTNHPIIRLCAFCAVWRQWKAMNVYN